jgi:excinuclease ABC subunit A
MGVVARSDWMIDIGPGAGDEGGRVVAAGPPEKVAQEKHGQTAKYLKRGRHLRGDLSHTTAQSQQRSISRRR